MNTLNPEFIVNLIAQTLGKGNLKKTISLHEPDFSKSNAWDYVKDCIDSGWVSSAGEWVTRFENKICKIIKAPYCVG